MFKNGITTLMEIGKPDKLKFLTPDKIKIPPDNAIITYKIFPTLFKIGPKVLARLFPFSEFINNSSLSFSNCFMLSSSWQNTFTTF